MAESQGKLTRKLAALPSWQLTLYAIPVAFCLYFCMYAFRKPYTAGTWEDYPDFVINLGFWKGALGYKSALVISQVLGYAISKLLGIKVCSEVSRGRRALTLVGTVVMAELALLLFAVTPDKWRVAVIFFNGIPLGMVWGLVVRYLEGRQTSELLLAGLSCSYILASGAVKNVGKQMMHWGVSEPWMPAATGALFFVPFLILVWLLNQVPAPTREDEKARTVRESMDRTHRWAFFLHFFWGMVMVTVAYFFMTAYRDFRDTYLVEFYEALELRGEVYSDWIISWTEMIVAFGVMAALAMVYLVKNNRWGLVAAYGIMVGGLVMLVGATAAFDLGYINGFAWLTMTGLGVYLAYVPFGSVLFDRLIASTHVVATAVFAIYFADAVGYGGSVGILVWKEFFGADMTKFDFFRQISYVMGAAGAVLMIASLFYFLYGHRHYHDHDQTRVHIHALPKPAGDNSTAESPNGSSSDQAPQPTLVGDN